MSLPRRLVRVCWLPDCVSRIGQPPFLGRHMREYRLFCLNDLGSLDFVETIMAADDKGAIREARHLKRRARKCEVWEGRRLVATLEADDLAA